MRLRKKRNWTTVTIRITANSTGDMAAAEPTSKFWMRSVDLVIDDVRRVARAALGHHVDGVEDLERPDMSMTRTNSIVGSAAAA